MKENNLSDKQDTCYIRSQDQLMKLLNTIQSLNQILADKKQNKKIDENKKEEYEKMIEPFKDSIRIKNDGKGYQLIDPYKMILSNVLDETKEIDLSHLIENKKKKKKAISNIDAIVNHPVMLANYSYLWVCCFVFRSIMRNENKYPNVLSDGVLKNTKSVIAFDKQKDYLSNIKYESVEDFFHNAHHESIPNVAEFIPWFKNKFGNIKINKKLVGGSMNIVFDAFGTNSVSDFNQLFEFIDPNELKCFFGSDKYYQVIMCGALNKVDESVLKYLPKNWLCDKTYVSNLKKYCAVGAFDDFNLNTWQGWCKLLGLEFKSTDVFEIIRDILAFFRFDRIDSWLYNLANNKLRARNQHNISVQQRILRVFKNKELYQWIIDNQEKSKKAKKERAQQNLSNQNNKQENRDDANNSIFKNPDELLIKTSTNNKVPDSKLKEVEK